MAILLVQAVLGITVVLIAAPSIVLFSIGLFVLIPLLYAWPMLAFAVILMTVPSFGTLLQLGKLDLRPNDLGIIVGVIGVAFLWIRERSIKIDIRGPDVPLLLIVGWVFLSLFWAPNLSLGTFQAVKVLFAALIYFAMVHLIKDEKTLHQALVIWFLVSVFWGLIGTYTFYFTSIPAAEKHTIIPGTLPHLGKTVRASSIFLDPNDYAFVLSISIMISVLFFFRSTSSGTRAFAVISIMMMLVVIIGTFSRKSWIGLALSVSLLGMKKRKVFLTVIILSIVSVGFIMWAGAGKFADALTNRVASFFLAPEISITERALAWAVAKKLFVAQPVLGNGAGSFFLLAPKMGSPLNIPHNFYWFILSEFGLVGISLFAIFVLNMCAGLLRILTRAVDPEQRLYCVVLLATIPSVLFQSAFKTIGFTEPIFLIFWAFIAAFLRIHTPSVANRPTSA